MHASFSLREACSRMGQEMCRTRQGTQARTLIHLIHPCCEPSAPIHQKTSHPQGVGGRGVFGHPSAQNFQTPPSCTLNTKHIPGGGGVMEEGGTGERYGGYLAQGLGMGGRNGGDGGLLRAKYRSSTCMEAKGLVSCACTTVPLY